MTGKTHYTVGTACALLAAQPDSLPTLGICLALSAVGSTICDIDSARSPSHRTAVKLFNGIALGVLLILACVRFLSLPLRVFTATELRPFAGIAGFLCICFVGAHMPHRSFMHSVLVLALLTLCVADVNQYAGLCYGAAMLSHILLDLANKRGVKLFYPLKKGVCLGFCPHNGTVNNSLFVAGAAVSALGVLITVVRIIITLTY